MNKNAIGIVNAMIDRFLELSLKSLTDDMRYASIDECRKYHGAWRKRADEYNAMELEKEYGPVTDVAPCPVCWTPVGYNQKSINEHFDSYGQCKFKFPYAT